MNPLTFRTGSDAQSYLVVRIGVVGTISGIDTLGLGVSGGVVSVEGVVGAGGEGTDSQALVGVDIKEGVGRAGLHTCLCGFIFSI